MLIYPGFDPIAFRIGPVKVHWYGIMYLLGFASGWWLGRVRAARPGSTWKANDVDDFVFFSMVGGILGGRIGYILFYGLKFWAADPWYPFKVWQGGMSIHGGILGAVAALGPAALPANARDPSTAEPARGAADRIGNTGAVRAAVVVHLAPAAALGARRTVPGVLWQRTRAGRVRARTR